MEDLQKAAVKYMGSAISAFQAHPILSGDTLAAPRSDWEFELQKCLAGGQSKIKGCKGKLPTFFDKKLLYLTRSSNLGENMFRFSLEMGRLCPKPGEFDEGHMAENVKVLATIKAFGQEPMLTVNHFTMPRFLTSIDKKGAITAGAWEHPEALAHIAFYIERVAEFLNDKDKIRDILERGGFAKSLQDKLIAEGLVKYFMSINEPFTVLENGYFFGVFPPFRSLRLRAIATSILPRMVAAHDIIRETLKRHGDAEVGVGYNWNYMDGFGGQFLHELLDVKITDNFERDGSHSDFLTLQYYFRLTLPFAGMHREGRDYSDHPFFGDIYPEGIYNMLMGIHAAYPEKKVFITEIGFADASDKRRPYWILETIRYVLQAKEQGVPVESVLLWSLVNNFEWNHGMNMKFGLFAEKELSNPLTASDPMSGTIRSWEAWEAAVYFHREPRESSKSLLDACYARAKAQYDAHRK
jgi:beta-glucosidase/6-phospho-beta-glucosidase/beta-galactosidase